MDTDTDAAPLTTRLESHRAFLRCLERRVGDRALAEDILQEAFAKVVARPELAPNDEAIIPWFYRTPRNAAVHQFRRRGAADRAYEAFARELETHEARTGEMRGDRGYSGRALPPGAVRQLGHRDRARSRLSERQKAPRVPQRR